jgi:hypothetical protein
MRTCLPVRMWIAPRAAVSIGWMVGACRLGRALPATRRRVDVLGVWTRGHVYMWKRGRVVACICGHAVESSCARSDKRTRLCVGKQERGRFAVWPGPRAGMPSRHLAHRRTCRERIGPENRVLPVRLTRDYRPNLRLQFYHCTRDPRVGEGRGPSPKSGAR